MEEQSILGHIVPGTKRVSEVPYSQIPKSAQPSPSRFGPRPFAATLWLEDVAVVAARVIG